MAYNSWTHDLKDSTKALQSVLPQLAKAVNGKFVLVEGDGHRLLKELDRISGIDLVSIFEGQIRGIASRCQWGNDWQTFTIRKERYTGSTTEYEKRIAAIAGNGMYPMLTLQMYFDHRSTNNLLSFGIMKTVDLYNLIETRPDIVKQNESDNVFIFIHWLAIKATDKKLIICKFY